MSHRLKQVKFLGPMLAALALIISVQPLQAADENQDGVKAPVSEARAPAITNAGFDELYINPRADFSQYRSVLIEDAPVSFVPGWVRKHRDEVNRREVELILKETAETLKVELAGKLAANEGYRIVAEVADDSLRIKPEIINLNLVSPGDRDRAKLVSSAGHATLSLEIFDARSNERLMKIVDYKMSKGLVDRDYYLANRVTNALELKQIMSVWADRIRAQMDLMQK